MDQIVISTRNLTKTFSGKEVIRNCNFSVERGSIYGFLGRNGAGKTTVLKLVLVFAYTVGAMLLCGAVIQAVFFLTESLFPLCSEQLTIEVILQSLGFLLCCSVLAGLLGVFSLWFGFRKKSVSMTIVASVILATIVCQVISAAIQYIPILWIIIGITGICSLIAVLDLFRQVEGMEV